jgi:hypothetical protein
MPESPLLVGLTPSVARVNMVVAVEEPPLSHPLVGLVGLVSSPSTMVRMEMASGLELAEMVEELLFPMAVAMVVVFLAVAVVAVSMAVKVPMPMLWSVETVLLAVAVVAVVVRLHPPMAVMVETAL